MNLVFDSSALLALLRHEPGADTVRNLLRNRDNQSWTHAVNLCEVFYDLLRDFGEESTEELIGSLLAPGLMCREDMDPEFWRQAGRYKADLCRVSLADCFCLTLAVRESASVVTADHEFDAVHARGLANVIFIR